MDNQQQRTAAPTSGNQVYGSLSDAQLFSAFLADNSRPLGNIGNDASPYPTSGPIEPRAAHRASVTADDIMNVFSDPQFGNYTPVAAAAPNDNLRGFAPLLDNAAGPSTGDLFFQHSGTSTANDFESAIIRYIRLPDSHIQVGPYQTYRQYPGSPRVKVLVSLEINRGAM